MTWQDVIAGCIVLVCAVHVVRVGLAFVGGTNGGCGCERGCGAPDIISIEGPASSGPKNVKTSDHE